MDPRTMPTLQMQASIEADIAARTKMHQAKLARLQSSKALMLTTGAPAATKPLVMLAHGDSWFDYPLAGNVWSPFQNTDVVAQLESMGKINPLILNMSHYGDATTDEMSLPKQERLIQALRDPANWAADGKPDAILFSGGGNDIVGEQFCIFLDYAAAGGDGLDADRFAKVLGMVEASYLDLFAFRDRYASGVPIFGHCYDFPIPNGVPAGCVGPWLKPSLDYCGFNVTQGTAIVRNALLGFRTMLAALANVPGNKFQLVDTQGTLVAADWANELHAIPTGFKKLADKFVATLQLTFPDRI
jgi:hypothetical protein